MNIGGVRGSLELCTYIDMLSADIFAELVPHIYSQHDEPYIFQTCSARQTTVVRRIHSRAAAMTSGIHAPRMNAEWSLAERVYGL